MGHSYETNAATETENSFKFLTADDAQSLASHPQHSAWVSASAGTGKTKVLTDRVLRLLLPRENGMEGTHARRILCLTYTKAAANEMAVRITKMLGSWAVMDVEHDDPAYSLRSKLEKLLDYVPSQAHIEAAKRLFAEVVDTPYKVECCGSYHTLNQKELTSRRAHKISSFGKERGKSGTEPLRR